MTHEANPPTLQTRFVCSACGAVYDGHAEYCNACGSVSFDRFEPEPSPGSSLRSDPTALIVHGTLWLVALVALLGERGTRDPVSMAWAWLLTATMGLVAGLVTKNLRTAGVFAVLGALFVGVAGLVRS